MPGSGLDNGKITPSQFMFAIILYIQSSSLLLAFSTSILKSDTWMAFLFALTAAIPIFLVYIGLMKSFPKLDLFMINELVYGKVGGKIISALYLWFFITLTSMNLRGLGDFVKQYVLLRTPLIIIIGVFILVCAYCVRQGIIGVTKFSTLICIIITVVTAVTLFMAPDLINFKDFLPLFDCSAKKYIQTTHLLTTVPLGELVIFLMFTPNIEFKKQEVEKKWILGVLFGSIYLMVILIRNISIFGDVIALFGMPSFESHKLLKIVRSINRIEIILAVELITMKFSKIAVLYYVVVLAFARFLNLKSYKPIVFVMGAFIAAYSILLYESTVDNLASTQQTMPFLWIIFEFFLPLITLLLAKARKLPQKFGGDGG